MPNLSEILNSEEFWDAAIPFIKRNREATESDYDSKELWERLECDDRIFKSERGEQFFERHIIAKLPAPPCITAKELQEIASQHLSGYDRPSIEALIRLEFFINSRLTDEVGELVDFGCWVMEEVSEAVDSFDISIPQVGGAIRLQVDVDPDPEKFLGMWKQDAYAGIVGEFTDEARCLVDADCRELLPALEKSLHLLGQNICPVVNPIAEILDKYAPKGFVTRARPRVSFLASDLAKTTCARWAASYWCRPQKKTDDMDQRARNAVQMMIRADQQVTPAIGLSLCFAAIEALVCWNNTGTVDELSRNVAALLEPNSVDRRNAKNRVKHLYALRSKAVHGEKIDVEQQAFEDARRLAAAVFAGFAQWECFQGRMDDSVNRATFRNALEDASTSGREMMGIPSEIGLRRCFPNAQ